MMKSDLVFSLVALVISLVALGFAVRSLEHSLAVLRAVGG
jgi:hypothetical protein